MLDTLKVRRTTLDDLPQIIQLLLEDDLGKNRESH
jgi:hypothetical protein